MCWPHEGVERDAKCEQVCVHVWHPETHNHIISAAAHKAEMKEEKDVEAKKKKRVK